MIVHMCIMQSVIPSILSIFLLNYNIYRTSRNCPKGCNRKRTEKNTALACNVTKIENRSRVLIIDEEKVYVCLEIRLRYLPLWSKFEGKWQLKPRRLKIAGFSDHLPWQSVIFIWFLGTVHKVSTFTLLVMTPVYGKYNGDLQLQQYRQERN